MTGVSIIKNKGLSIIVPILNEAFSVLPKFDRKNLN